MSEDKQQTIEIERQKREREDPETLLPSNAEIESTMDKAIESIEKQKDNPQVNERGKKIADDFEQLIGVAEKAIEDKNSNNELQKLFDDSLNTIGKNLPALVEENIRLNFAPAKLKMDVTGEVAKQVYESYLKDLSLEFIRSRDFRNLVLDWIAVFQYLATRKIKEEVRKAEAEGKVDASIIQKIEPYLDEPELPDIDPIKRTEQLISHLVQRMRKIDYRESFHNFIRFLEELATRVEQVVEKDVTDEIQRFQSKLNTDPFWNVIDDIGGIVSHYVGEKNFADLKQSLIDLYTFIANDKDLRQWFWELRNFLESSWEAPSDVSKEMVSTEVKELVQKGSDFFQKDRLANIFKDISTEIRRAGKYIAEDDTTKEFGRKLRQLGKDLSMNSRGHFDLFAMEDSVVQIKNIMVPIVKEQLEKIDITKIKFSDETYDVMIQGMRFRGSFLPENIDCSLRNNTHLDLTDGLKDVSTHSLIFSVDHLKPEFHNIKFYYKRKTFPEISDYGVVDLNMSGEGAMIRINWKLEKHGKEPLQASVGDVTVHIDKLEILIDPSKTKHDVLDRVLIFFLNTLIKNKVQEAIEDYLKETLSKFNDTLNHFLLANTFDMKGVVKDALNSKVQTKIEQAEEMRQNRQQLEAQ